MINCQKQNQKKEQRKNNMECNEECQLFRFSKCETKDPAGKCDQPKRYDNALNEWGDPKPR